MCISRVVVCGTSTHEETISKSQRPCDAVFALLTVCVNSTSAENKNAGDGRQHRHFSSRGEIRSLLPSTARTLAHERSEVVRPSRRQVQVEARAACHAPRPGQLILARKPSPHVFFLVYSTLAMLKLYINSAAYSRSWYKCVLISN